MSTEQTYILVFSRLSIKRLQRNNQRFACEWRKGKTQWKRNDGQCRRVRLRVRRSERFCEKTARRVNESALRDGQMKID